MHCLFRSKPEHKKERGNVLFIILLAVALFAALSYVVTSSTRSGGGNASREQTILALSQILQYGANLESSITRMKISNGCTDSQISFENLIVSGYTNPSSPSNKYCNVFDPAGGNVQWQKPPLAALNSSLSSQYEYGQYLFTGLTRIYNVGTNTGGSSGIELIFSVPFVTRDICIEINKKNGLSPSGAEPPYYNSLRTLAGTTKFNGTYSYAIDLADFPHGYPYACGVANNYEYNGVTFPNSYHIYYVIIPR